jgi:hypothetical protein
VFGLCPRQRGALVSPLTLICFREKAVQKVFPASRFQPPRATVSDSWIALPTENEQKPHRIGVGERLGRYRRKSCGRWPERCVGHCLGTGKVWVGEYFCLACARQPDSVHALRSVTQLEEELTNSPFPSRSRGRFAPARRRAVRPPPRDRTAPAFRNMRAHRPRLR